MQLYAFLESVEENVRGLDRQVVIYRVSNKSYQRAYKEVRKRFYNVEFRLQEKKNPQKDFQTLVLSIAFDKEARAKYLLFGTDDCLIVRPVDLECAIRAMNQVDAYGFYFRLGLNIDYCYMTSSYSGVPVGEDSGEFFVWTLASGAGDWCYGNNVDFTLYRKRDIQPVLESLSFENPNTMESKWAKKVECQKKGICYKNSCAINIPLNTVAFAFNNRHMDWSSAAELLHHFVYGKKIDIRPIQGIGNRSPHVEITPDFIQR